MNVRVSMSSRFSIARLLKKVWSINLSVPPKNFFENAIGVLCPFLGRFVRGYTQGEAVDIVPYN